MDIRHLRYFVAVAEERHVTRAAERLGIQQPPLSQQIKALEEELEVRLFHRKPRGVELTDAGEALLPDARRILADVEAALLRVRRTARGEQGRIAVGFTSSVPFHPFVPEALRDYRESHPLVSMPLEEGGTADLVAAIAAERLDVAFIRSPASDAEGIAVYELLNEPMVVALPAAHRLGQRKRPARIRLAELADEPFVLFRRASGPGLYDAITGACHAAGFTPRLEQEAPRIVATLNLVAAGLGVTLVPESLSSMHLDGVRFCALSRDEAPRAPIRLACRRTDHSAAARLFVEDVRRKARA